MIAARIAPWSTTGSSSASPVRTTRPLSPSLIRSGASAIIRHANASASGLGWCIATGSSHCPSSDTSRTTQTSPSSSTSRCVTTSNTAGRSSWLAANACDAPASARARAAWCASWAWTSCEAR